MNYIEVPISENIRVVRSEDDNSAKVQLFNKETGELIETFGEIIESVTPAPNSLSSDNTLAENLILQAYNERTDYKNVTTRLTVKMEGYRSGSFVQINKVLSNKLAIVNSNKYYLEAVDEVYISATGSFPTTQIVADGSAVLTYVKRKGETGSIGGTADFIKGGFEVTYEWSDQVDWYARKPIHVTVNYKTM